jgi:hypothetical protein
VPGQDQDRAGHGEDASRDERQVADELAVLGGLDGDLVLLEELAARLAEQPVALVARGLRVEGEAEADAGGDRGRDGPGGPRAQGRPSRRRARAPCDPDLIAVGAWTGALGAVADGSGDGALDEVA